MVYKRVDAVGSSPVFGTSKSQFTWLEAVGSAFIFETIRFGFIFKAGSQFTLTHFTLAHVVRACARV